MRNFCIIVTVVVVTGLFSSCTTLLMVPKRYPPEITPEKKPATAVLVNNFDYSNRDIVIEKRKDTYRRAVHSFIKGFLNGITSSDSLEIIVGDTLRKETPAGMLTTLLPVDTIADYCNRYNANMMIVLDSVNIGFDTKAAYLESVSWINFYSRTFSLYGEFFMSAYSPNGDVINRSSVDKETMYSWRIGITSEVAFDPSVAAAIRKIDRIAVPAGEEFAKKFRFTFENVERKVYTGGKLDASNELMRSGKWDEAVKELEKLSETSRGPAAKHAKANLEIAKEGAGGGE